MHVFRHVRFALLRAWTVPARSGLALVASALAWVALFSTASDIKDFNDEAARAGQLGGARGYQISVKKVYNDKGAPRSAILPRNFVEIAHRFSGALVLQLDRTVGIVSVDRQTSTSKRVMLYGEGLGIHVRNDHDFPVCALYRPDEEWKQENVLIPLASGWRCILVGMPPPLTALSNSVDSENIVFPLSRVDDAAGTAALDHVQTMWIGIATEEELGKLEHIALETYKLDLEIIPLGLEFVGQVASVTSATKSWLAMAILSLVLGTVLYVQGVYRAMRCEIGLRVCLGEPLASLTRWLVTDVLAQAWSLMLASAALGWMVFSFFDVKISLTEAGLLLAILCGAVACLFVVGCMIVTSVAVNNAKIVTTIRS